MSKINLPKSSEKPKISTDFIAHLSDRVIFEVSGEDRFTFLQGLITQDVFKLQKAENIILYSALLTPQGKFLFDFFVSQNAESIWIDCDIEKAEALIKKLSLYRLRSKVTLNMRPDIFIYAVSPHADKGFADPRCDVLPKRFYTAHKLKEQHNEISYQQILEIYAIPTEGAFEIEKSTAAEVNLDYLNALDWQKGCYMGQELTARVHYRGLVKRRLLPFIIQDSESANVTTGMAILSEGVRLGEVRQFNPETGVGMALVKLDSLKENAHIEDTGVSIRFFKPEWFAD